MCSLERVFGIFQFNPDVAPALRTIDAGLCFRHAPTFQLFRNRLFSPIIPVDKAAVVPALPGVKEALNGYLGFFILKVALIVQKLTKQVLRLLVLPNVVFYLFRSAQSHPPVGRCTA